MYPFEYDLILKPDVNTQGHTQWFYFSVARMVPGIKYKFNIINLLKPDSLYNHGMQPVVFSAVNAEVCATCGGCVGWGVYGACVSGGLVPGAWCMVPGAWCLVPGAWCLVPGAWCLVPGAWCMWVGEILAWNINCSFASHLQSCLPLVACSLSASDVASAGSAKARTCVTTRTLSGAGVDTTTLQPFP